MWLNVSTENIFHFLTYFQSTPTNTKCHYMCYGGYGVKECIHWSCDDSNSLYQKHERKILTHSERVQRWLSYETLIMVHWRLRCIFFRYFEGETNKFICVNSGTRSGLMASLFWGNLFGLLCTSFSTVGLGMTMLTSTAD